MEHLSQTIIHFYTDRRRLAPRSMTISPEPILIPPAALFRPFSQTPKLTAKETKIMKTIKVIRANRKPNDNMYRL